MYFGIDNNQHIQTILNNEIKIVDNFKYLGSWMQISEKDLNIRKSTSLVSRPVRSIQFLILHIKYNTYLYFSIICINNFYKKIVTFGHEAFKV